VVKKVSVTADYRRVTDGRTDRQTDGQSGERTSCVGIVRAMYAVTTIFVVFVVFNFVRCPCNVFDMIVST